MNKKMRLELSVMVLLLVLDIALAKLCNVSCIFLKITGIPCPGCGMTRALFALCSGKIGLALSYNSGILVMPIFAIEIVFDGKWLKNRYLDSMLIAGSFLILIIRYISIICI